MSRPKLLDLFCKQGGAGTGYHLAGFDVVGVDKEPQPRYPFRFIKGDALALLADRDFIAQFDAIHASPPCQSESDLRHRTGIEYVDLLTPTLALLADVETPWVVENVASTMKLPGALMLCGTEFGLSAVTRTGERRWLKRHRLFGANVMLMGAGGCQCRGHLIGGVYGGGGGQMTRGYAFHKPEAADVMGIDWMCRDGLAQAIPPAYTRFIGEQLLEALDRGEVAA